MAIKKTKKAPRGRPYAGGPKPIVGLRLQGSEIDQIDALANGEGVKRSEMVRRLLLAGIAAYKPSKTSK